MNLISVADATEITHRSKPTIYRWIEQGKIRTFETSAGLMVDGREVMEAAAKQKRGRPKRHAA